MNPTPAYRNGEPHRAEMGTHGDIAEHNGAPVEHHRIAIVGSGFAGLGAAIRLRQAGIEDFVVFERGEAVGGTWNFNTYPGCQCDIPSHLYSFSFAPNPNWSRTYSKQPEIFEYLRRCSREHGIDAHVRLRCEVTSASWDEQAQLWRIHTRTRTAARETGDDVGRAIDAQTPREVTREPTIDAQAPSEVTRELTAEVLIGAAGPLSQPKLPDIPGIEDFQGTIFHSAQWNHQHDLKGERVAVIGTGASSIQLVPHLQRDVAKLHLFQRTPAWVVPHRDRKTTRLERWLYRRVPALQRLVRAGVYFTRELFVPYLMHPRAGSLPERLAQRHLHAQVKDPALRAKLTPDYRIGCKRVLISNDYYPALCRPNVELVTHGITAIGAKSVRSADGVEREVDTIVLGTGFHVTDMPIADWICGRNGATLAETWQGSPQAYLGSTVAGFPNMFLLVGPNMGLGHNSIVFMIEAQLNYLMDCLRVGESHRMDIFEVRESTQRAFNERVQRRLQGSVWTSGGCHSWYLDAKGRNTTIWPGFTWSYHRRTRRFVAADYKLRTRTVPAARSNLAPARKAAEPVGVA
jgi:cation diffusion facilitator CzcD-associated flavoprotein CzcO